MTCLVKIHNSSHKQEMPKNLEGAGKRNERVYSFLFCAVVCEAVVCQL